MTSDRKDWYTIQFHVKMAPNLQRYQFDTLRIATAIMQAMDVELVDGVMICKAPKKPLWQRIKQYFWPVILLGRNK